MSLYAAATPLSGFYSKRDSWGWGRIIMHVDMDAFFASVEQAKNPYLKGKPVAVVGSGKRTVITTASYEARERGVKTGMNIYEAKRVCPEVIIIRGNNRLYTYTSSVIFKILGEYTPLMEPRSIDEAFLDLTGTHLLYGNPIEIAKEIKRRILKRFGITLSAGIAPNKLLAKLASGMNKPDGLCVIAPHDVEAVLKDLPVSELCGIGKKTAQKLALLGINRCGELAACPPSKLRAIFGIFGDYIHMMARGIDPSPVVPPSRAPEVKSIGHSMTFSEDISDPTRLRGYLLRLSEMVGARMRKYRLWGKTVAVTIRYPDFRTTIKRKSWPDPTSDTIEIYRRAIEVFNIINPDEPVRLMGVSVSSLKKDRGQLEIFRERDCTRRGLMEVIDNISTRFGAFSISFADAIAAETPDVISPAWRPNGPRRHLG